MTAGFMACCKEKPAVIDRRYSRNARVHGIEFVNFRLRTLVANFSNVYKSFTGPESFLDKGRTFVSCTPHLRNEPDPGRKGLSHLRRRVVRPVPTSHRFSH